MKVSIFVVTWPSIYGATFTKCIASLILFVLQSCMKYLLAKNDGYRFAPPILQTYFTDQERN
jgi:hypothetical protein